MPRSLSRRKSWKAKERKEDYPLSSGKSVVQAARERQKVGGMVDGAR